MFLSFRSLTVSSGWPTSCKAIPSQLKSLFSCKWNYLDRLLILPPALLTLAMLSLSEYPAERCWVRWRKSSLVRSEDDVRLAMFPMWLPCGWLCEWLRTLLELYKGAPYLRKLSAFILPATWVVGTDEHRKFLRHNATCNAVGEASWRSCSWGGAGESLVVCTSFRLAACGLHLNCFFVSARKLSDRTTGRRRVEVELKRTRTQAKAFIDSGGWCHIVSPPDMYIV